MGVILAVFRLIAFGLIMLLYMMIVLILSLFVGGDKTRASRPFRTPIIRLAMFFLGVKIKQTGSIPERNVLFVGNHISYLDPFIVVFYTIAWPVAKNEIASWPLIGYAISISGVLFVKRLNANSLKATRDAIATKLLEGKSVIVYPEGTTSDGKTLLPLKRGVFDIACEHKIPVVPVTIYFGNEDAAFIRKQKFLPHFMKLFSTWRNTVFLHFGNEIQVENSQVCMEKAKEQIARRLSDYQESVS